MNGTPQSALPSAPPPKKPGLSPLAWIGIGCGVLAVLAMIVMGGLVVAGGWFVKKQIDKVEANPALAAAKLVVRANPDYDLVKTDEKAGTITVREVKTGDVMTLNLKDVVEGRFEVETKDGKATFDASGKDGTLKVSDDKGQVATLAAGSGAPRNLPSWLPVYPGGTVQGTFDTINAEGRTAAFTVTTTDPGDKVLSFYESRFKEAGLKVDATATASGTEGSGGILTASGESPHREVSVLVASSGGQTQATLNFQEKK
ncbi:MAG TPA: hypothetical protein VHC97_19980 [Thermoanaerobaculia bacterium]|jgi:hypothetical protein|nr:hypothetical protein [Thermoanaerobaculia bacterium]